MITNNQGVCIKVASRSVLKETKACRPVPLCQATSSVLWRSTIQALTARFILGRPLVLVVFIAVTETLKTSTSGRVYFG